MTETPVIVGAILIMCDAGCAGSLQTVENARDSVVYTVESRDYYYYLPSNFWNIHVGTASYPWLGYSIPASKLDLGKRADLFLLALSKSLK